VSHSLLLGCDKGVSVQDKPGETMLAIPSPPMNTSPLLATPGRSAVLLALAMPVVASTAHAQTYSGSDSVFAPSSWTVTVKGNNPTQSGSATQDVGGYGAGVNAWTSTVNPNGSADTWTVSIFEGFSYSPSSGSGQPAGVTVSFDSRWITRAFSGVGPALRQGSNIWAGYQPSDLNSTSWLSYTFSGWATLLSGTSSMPAPDFSAGAAPIYFGFYQRNGGGGPNQSQFANFSVVVTVPAPAALALAGIAMPFAGRRRRSR